MPPPSKPKPLPPANPAPTATAHNEALPAPARPAPAPPRGSGCQAHYGLTVELLEKNPGHRPAEQWTPVASLPGNTFSRTSPRFGYLGRGELRARITSTCPPGAGRDDLAVMWKVDDVGVTIPVRTDAAGVMIASYQDMVTAGSYQVQLWVNRMPGDSTQFTVTK